MVSDKSFLARRSVVRHKPTYRRVRLEFVVKKVTIIYLIVGATTRKLDELNAGDFICDFVGPLDLSR